MVDPEEAGATELGKSPNIEGNRLTVTAEELSREFSPNSERFILTYRGRINISAKFLG